MSDTKSSQVLTSKVPDFTLSDGINLLRANNNELRSQINSINEKLYTIGRSVKIKEVVAREVTSMLDDFSNELSIYTELINDLSNTNGAFGSI